MTSYTDTTHATTAAEESANHFHKLQSEALESETVITNLRAEMQRHRDAAARSGV